MGKYPGYCPMASRWSKLELWLDGPLIGDPDWIHVQYPGDASLCPFPDCPSLATFCYPMHDVISITTRGAKGRVRKPNGMKPLLGRQDVMNHLEPVDLNGICRTGKMEIRPHLFPVSLRVQYRNAHIPGWVCCQPDCA